MRSTTRFLWVAWIAAFSLLHHSAWAGPLPPQNGVRSIPLEPYSSWLLDPSGRLSFSEVSDSAHADRFQPLTGPLSQGFTSAVVWVRISLTSNESSQWLLEVGQPILEDVRLYTQRPGEEVLQFNGTLIDANLPRQLDYRRPIFEVDLTADVPTVLYLRLASRTSMVTNLKLWSPNALFEASNQETFVWGLVFGSYLLVLFFYSAFWVWTREKVHLYYVLYVGTNLGAAFMTGHWNDMLGWYISPHAQTLILGIFICLSLWIAPVFSVKFLGTHKIWPRLSRLYLMTCTTISMAGIALVLLGFYGQSVMAIQVSSMFVICITLAVSGHLAWRGDKKAQLLLLAFSLFYVGIVWRYMRNIGLIEPTWWNESVYQVGAFVHMMVMSTGIFSSYNTLRRKSEQDLARTKAQERQRHRQYEFLGMVSHEVRTPLTVISASADNLLLDSSVSASTKTRLDKIIRHCEKLQHLFDSYLDNERLLNGDKPITMSMANLTALCEAAVQDMQDAHGVTVGLETELLPDVMCNADLIRVAITNLLENARKYTTDESGIVLRIRRVGKLAEMSVTDQGPGVDPEDMPFIFDAYYRGKGAHPSKGSGLGLHLVKFIAEQHKGRVFADKLQPRGMQFVIEIPLEE